MQLKQIHTYFPWLALWTSCSGEFCVLGGAKSLFVNPTHFRHKDVGNVIANYILRKGKHF